MCELCKVGWTNTSVDYGRVETGLAERMEFVNLLKLDFNH